MADSDKQWSVYLIECSNGAYYTGITNDVEKRYQAHCRGKGAKYTRANPPVRMIGHQVAGSGTKSDAAKAEVHIRTLSRPNKVAYFN